MELSAYLSWSQEQVNASVIFQQNPFSHSQVRSRLDNRVNMTVHRVRYLVQWWSLAQFLLFSSDLVSGRTVVQS